MNEQFLEEINKSKGDYLSTVAALYNGVENGFRAHFQNRSTFDHVKNELDRNSTSESNGFASQSLTILKLNVGGRHIDIKRKTIVDFSNVDSCWNLLSQLLCERWDKYLPKDKNGRIFLDFDPEWIEGIFDFLRLCDLNSSTRRNFPSFPIVDLIHRHGYSKIVSGFALRNVFSSVVVLEPGLIGLDSIFPQVNAKQTQFDIFTTLCPAALSAPQDSTCLVQLLYRGSHDGFKQSDLLSKCLYKSHLMCFVQDTSNQVFGAYVCGTFSNGESSITSGLNGGCLFTIRTHGNGGLEKSAMHSMTAKKITHSGLGIRGAMMLSVVQDNECLILSPNCTSGNVANFTTLLANGAGSTGASVQQFIARDVEVWHVVHTKTATHSTPYYSPVKITSASPQQTIEEVSEDTIKNQFVRTNLTDIATECVSHLDKVSVLAQQLVKENDLFDAEVEQFLKELCFVVKFVSFNADVEATQSNKDDENVSVIEKVQANINQLQQLHHASLLQSNHGDEDIVYFNVSGEKVCVRRSSILAALPDSQLARRLSGSWTEQTHDLDDEGNIFVDLPKAAFLRLISFVRLDALCRLQGCERPTQITVLQRDAEALKIILDYYAIPDFPVTVI